MANALRAALVLELRRVDADHDERVAPLLFEPVEVGDDVEAVDAARRPEIEEHEPAAQGPKRDRRGGVEPGEAGREVGGADGHASGGGRGEG